MILTSKHCAKHPLAGWNTQHLAQQFLHPDQDPKSIGHKSARDQKTFLIRKEEKQTFQF